MTNPESPETPPSRTFVAKFRRLLRYLRLRPFDVTTVQGRADERYRRAALTSAANALARGIKLATALISIPLTINYLGSERYGIWLTVSSLVSFIVFADLGIGNGLMNPLSHAFGQNDRKAMKVLVSSASFLLLGSTAALAAIFALVYPLVPWVSLYNVETELARSEVGLATIAFFGCWLANLCLGVIIRVNLSFQQGFANYLWQALGSLLGLGGLLCAIHVEAGLHWLILSMAGGPVVATFLNGITLFGIGHRWVMPSIRFFDLKRARALLKLGLWFVLLELTLQLLMNSGNVVIAQILGSDQVAQHAVPGRLFFVIAMAAQMIVFPLWPAYTESLSRGDLKWVRRTLVGSLRLSILIAVVPATALVAFGKPIIHAWVGDTVQPTTSLLLGYGIWTVLHGIRAATSMFFNGVHYIRFQAIMNLFEGFGVLVLEIVFVREWGFVGAVWGMVIAEIIFRTIPAFVAIPKILRRLSSSCSPSKVKSENQ